MSVTVEVVEPYWCVRGRYCLQLEGPGVSYSEGGGCMFLPYLL